MDYIKYDVQDQVGVITIDRPKALNALNDQVLKELEETFDQVNQEEIYLFWKFFSFRFSRKADMPSTWSSESKQLPK